LNFMNFKREKKKSMHLTLSNFLGLLYCALFLASIGFLLWDHYNDHYNYSTNDIPQVFKYISLVIILSAILVVTYFMFRHFKLDLNGKFEKSSFVVTVMFFVLYLICGCYTIFGVVDKDVPTGSSSVFYQFSLYYTLVMTIIFVISLCILSIFYSHHYFNPNLCIDLIAGLFKAF